jgi:NADPH:quinone reductase-like Zn-dependent oxidoreductase
VLIYGASGGVGVAAVQIAKHLGACVTGVCGPNNLNLVQSLGADAVLDYTRDDFSKDGRSYDVVVDCVGKAKISRVLRSLKRGGVFIRIAGAMLPQPSLMLANATGAAKIIGPMPEIPGAEPVRQLYQLAASGALKAVIGARFAFIDIAEAHAYAESGHKVGAALVTVNKCATPEAGA